MVPQLEYSRLISEISGGEFANLGLARAQIVKPRICLLDEPSNNLDFAGRKRLVRFVPTLDIPLSWQLYDRDIMDCFDKIWEISDGRLTQIDGSFADYLNHVKIRRAETTHELKQSTKRSKEAEKFS